MRNIVWPNEKGIQPGLVGGKAWNLIQLSKAGFNVPNFFVVTTAVFNSTSFYLEEEILENFKKLNSLHVAIRSSATCEDKVNSSFAGQFESYLAMPRGKLMEMVKGCWASVASPRVLAYATHHNIPPTSIKMAVIVQEMISAEKGGVIFSQNIFENDSNQLIIEAASGLGERVVSSLVNPERIIVNKASKRIVEKESPTGKVLTNKEIEELANIALKIENFYKAAQDIEWAIENGKVFILQSRPITTLLN